MQTAEMRYYKFSAAERKLVMAEAELPEPAPGQVRVRIAAASLNYRDVFMISRFAEVGIDNRIPLSDGRFIERHRITPVVDREFAFDEALQAFAHMAEQRHFGKLVINVAGG